MYELVDLTGLDFSLSRDGSGSAGSFYKAVDKRGTFYKVSYPLKDGFGYESVNEVLCSRLANLFGFPNAKYTLVNAKIRLIGEEYNTYLCKSSNFKLWNERRVTLETYEVLNSIEKGYIQPLIFKPFYSDLVNMIFLDYLIDNRDRHGANIELLVNGSNIRLAPIFDCGSSLLAPCQYNEGVINSFDYLHNGPVNNFLISMWWSDILDVLKSLGFVVPKINIGGLYYEDLKVAFKDSQKYILDKEVDMIKARYEYVKKVFDTSRV